MIQLHVCEYCLTAKLPAEMFWRGTGGVSEVLWFPSFHSSGYPLVVVFTHLGKFFVQHMKKDYSTNEFDLLDIIIFLTNYCIHTSTKSTKH